jgi:hypothetical protein
LNDIRSKVRTGKHLSDAFPIQNCLQLGRRRFVAIALQLWFGIRYQGDLKKQKRIGTEWDKSASGLCL